MPILVAVQPRMSVAAYRSEAAFRAWLREAVAPALAELASPEPCLVAFPEFVGLPLLLMAAPSRPRPYRTWLQAGVLLTGMHLRAVHSLMGRYRVGWKRALLLVLSRRHVRRVYHDAFSGLARELGATVVAGSAAIEGPEGEVSNTCCVFGPDGALLGRQRKVNLTTDEEAGGLDLFPGTLAETAPIGTPAGRVGVAICLDGFDVDTSRGEPRPQPSVCRRLAEQGAEILVQPSCNQKPWSPEEAAVWQEGLQRRMAEHAVFRFGLNPMMVGRVLDLAAEGRSSILGPGGRECLARAESPRGPACLVGRGGWPIHAYPSDQVDPSDPSGSR